MGNPPAKLCDGYRERLGSTDGCIGNEGKMEREDGIQLTTSLSICTAITHGNSARACDSYSTNRPLAITNMWVEVHCWVGRNTLSSGTKGGVLRKGIRPCG